jgi:hypothetical protein
MASPFQRAASANVGTAPVTVFTVPADKVFVLIDCSCANVVPGLTEAKGTVRHIQGATTAHLVKDGPIPVGSAMVVVGGSRKVVMREGDQLVALSNIANGFDIVASYLEQAE